MATVFSIEWRHRWIHSWKISCGMAIPYHSIPYTYPSKFPHRNFTSAHPRNQFSPCDIFIDFPAVLFNWHVLLLLLSLFVSGISPFVSLFFLFLCVTLVSGFMCTSFGGQRTCPRTWQPWRPKESKFRYKLYRWARSRFWYNARCTHIKATFCHR